MKSANFLVMSSYVEGFPNTLLESLVVGTPVISFDCPSGPSEILDGGRFGHLVPVGYASALAQAIETALDSPIDNAFLQVADVHATLAALVHLERHGCGGQQIGDDFIVDL